MNWSKSSNKKRRKSLKNTEIEEQGPEDFEMDFDNEIINNTKGYNEHGKKRFKKSKYFPDLRQRHSVDSQTQKNRYAHNYVPPYHQQESNEKKKICEN